MADEPTTAALRRAIKAIEEKSKGLKPPLGTNESPSEGHWEKESSQASEILAEISVAGASPVSNRKPFKQTRRRPNASNLKAAPSTDLSDAAGPSGEPDDVESASRLLGESDAAEVEATARAMLRRSALNLLAQREQTAFELKQKLSRRFPEQAALLDEVIERLQEQGLQDDTRMAEAYVRYRVQRGQGPMKIRSEMMQKGLTGDDIDTAFRRQAPDWGALAATVLQKRFGEVAESASIDQKERAKRSRFLQQRGFRYEHISAAL
ncbi:recombination regulator RecX [Pseudomonadales bacterium]|nr:recombination regulator RecX [Pseudomonadales bacterium]